MQAFLLHPLVEQIRIQRMVYRFYTAILLFLPVTESGLVSGRPGSSPQQPVRDGGIGTAGCRPPIRISEQDAQPNNPS